MKPVISVENLSKSYRLGVIGSGTFKDDFKRWWARTRGLPDPLAIIGQSDHQNRSGEIVWALQDVSFQVKEGEALGIIGRNGAGKSTLLKILSRVTAPTKGEVKIKGRIASLLEVGTGFHPELTGRENIYMNGAILGMTKPEIRKKFDEIVDFAGVEKYINTPVKRYSSGMYVRLAFAVAAHLDPEILIVDEVLAVGDAEFQKKCLGKMDEVTKGGRTVLFVSHNMASIINLCNKCISLQSGFVDNYGSPEQVINKYLRSDNNREKPEIIFTEKTIRKGFGYVKFNSLRIHNCEGDLQRQFNIGEDIIFDISVSSSSSVIGKKIKFAMEIKSSDGLKICNIVDLDSNFQIIDTRQHEVISIRFNDIRFYPGVYYISLWAGSITSTDVYDYLEDCLSFEIIGGGKLTMRKLPRSAGILFLTPEWTRKNYEKK
jgi:lipopolysaccharide transport system ATP-binding protein